MFDPLLCFKAFWFYGSLYSDHKHSEFFGEFCLDEEKLLKREIDVQRKCYFDQNSIQVFRFSLFLNFHFYPR